MKLDDRAIALVAGGAKCQCPEEDDDFSISSLDMCHGICCVGYIGSNKPIFYYDHSPYQCGHYRPKKLTATASSPL